MAAPSRAAQFAQMHKVLKKHYKPISMNANRSVLENAVFACLAENAHYTDAEEVYATVIETYYDWNEVRVTTIRELSETMSKLPDPTAAAARLRNVLQHVFENGYVFDLEHLRKQNLGPTVAELKKICGMTPFAISFVIQSALGGHAIPLDPSSLQVLRILDFATEKEVEESTVAGLERAIPKNKGCEFGSLLHELAACFLDNPFAAPLKKILLEINPDAKDRLPKRGEQPKEEILAASKPVVKKPVKKGANPVLGDDLAAKKGMRKAEKTTAKRRIIPTKKKVKSPPPVKKSPQDNTPALPTAMKSAPASSKAAPTSKPAATPPAKKAASPATPASKAAAPKAASSKASPSKTPASKTPSSKVTPPKAPSKGGSVKKTVKKTVDTSSAKKASKKETSKAPAKKKGSQGIGKRKPR